MKRFFKRRTWLLFWIIGVSTAVAIESCTKQSEDVLIAQQHTVTCDTTNIKLSVNVMPIFKANCYRCHGNGLTSGGVSLDVYTSLLTQANNGNLIGDITHAPGHVNMPFDGGKLSDCEIAIIQAWINAGAPNN
jgi:cytochrome c553